MVKKVLKAKSIENGSDEKGVFFQEGQLHDKAERDPSNIDSEAYRFIEYIEIKGVDYGPSAWRKLFLGYTDSEILRFINQLIDDGWIMKEYKNRLDFKLMATDKYRQIGKKI